MERQDLLFRLNTIEIHLPPLRERREDIPLLAAASLDQHCRRYRKSLAGFEDAALHALISAETEAGRLADARAHARELCEITAAESGTPHVEALWAASRVHTMQGDHVGAQQLLERALDRLRREQDPWLRLAAASLYLWSAGAAAV